MSHTNENQNLGARIAQVRLSQEMKLRELAEKIQLSPSMVSQIEKGHVNPSLNTLRSIATALGVPLFTFFLEELSATNLVVRAGTGRKIKQPQSNLEYTLLSPDLSGSIEMAVMKLEPHSVSFQELLSHTGEEMAYVESGECLLHLGNQIITLQTGDSVRIPPGIQHKWENQSDAETAIIFAITPPTF
ncbi:MAG: cupin domain-containing protein [Sporomusaceae bacterium]|nr:cupin domain-containing protein [Sporomusaceae bacterium]